MLLAEDRPAAAVDALAAARSGWVDLQAPYQPARTRVLLSRALREVGDADTAAIELGVATREFEQVGATSELERLTAPSQADDGPAAGLTARELEVVRLVAAGHTNREIAAELVISDKTVAHHLHNVFTKLDLPNRSAATAYAYEHRPGVGDIEAPEWRFPMGGGQLDLTGTDVRITGATRPLLESAVRDRRGPPRHAGPG